MVSANWPEYVTTYIPCAILACGGVGWEEGEVHVYMPEMWLDRSLDLLGSAKRQEPITDASRLIDLSIHKIINTTPYDHDHGHGHASFSTTVRLATRRCEERSFELWSQRTQSTYLGDRCTAAGCSEFAFPKAISCTVV